MDQGGLQARLDRAFPRQPHLRYSPQAPEPAVPPERTRSRSRHAPLRAGAADRRPRTRGVLPSLASPEARAAALEDFHADLYAASSQVSLGFKWRTVTRMIAAWGLEVLPPTVEKIYLLGAALKAGGYRSAAGYLSLYRTTCGRHGHDFGPALALALRDAVRSCQRGQGAPVQATPLPMRRFHELPGGRDAWAAGGPLSPRNALVTGAWWLLREVELSTLRARLAEASCGVDGVWRVHLTLPASKSDQEARGTARGHRCRCASLPSPFGCPVCAVRDQLSFLARQFPQRWAGGLPDWQLPLFPQITGEASTKEAVVTTLTFAAGLLQVPLMSRDGSTRISGHTLRVSGAQGLTREGFPLWSVQLLGRWGGDTVRRYVGEAALGVFTEDHTPTPRTGAEHLDLETVLSDAVVPGATPEAAAGSVRSLPARVEAAVLARAGALREELLEALRTEVRLEVARSAPVPPPPTETASTGTDPDPTWIQNTRTKCFHHSAVGTESGLPLAAWVAKCGWTYGRFGGFAVGPPTPGADTCDHCLGRTPATRRLRRSESA